MAAYIAQPGLQARLQQRFLPWLEIEPVVGPAEDHIVGPFPGKLGQGAAGDREQQAGAEHDPEPAAQSEKTPNHESSTSGWLRSFAVCGTEHPRRRDHAMHS